MQKAIDVYSYLRHEKKFPHIWCAGCGNGIIVGSMIRAIDGLGLDKNSIAMVSGIGCSGRTSTYVDFNTLHTTHGRALAFATGLKFARPELTTLVVMGDGDCLSNWSIPRRMTVLRMLSDVKNKCKGWSRKKKQALIEGRYSRLVEYSRNYTEFGEPDSE